MQIDGRYAKVQCNLCWKYGLEIKDSLDKHKRLIYFLITTANTVKYNQ